jgi:hypothetical protein
LGVGDKVREALVLGDSLFEDLDDLIGQGQSTNHLETGRFLADVRPDMLSVNCYLGSPS